MGRNTIKTLIQFVSKFVAFALLTIASSTSVFAAGGTVTFTLPSTNPTAVPSLSGTMLIVLSLLLFIVAFRISKQKNTNVNKLFAMLFCTGVLISVLSEVKMVSDADAGGPVSTPISLTQQSNTIDFTIADGETLNFTNEGASAINFSIVVDLIAAGTESFCSYQIDGPIAAGSLYIVPTDSEFESTQPSSGVLPAGSTIRILCEED